MTKEKLKKVLDLHIKWLIKEESGERANLSEADLSEADLRWANLRGADLREADLSGANLRGADLRGANLRGANLRWANLRGADLRGANLSEADLREADLRDVIYNENTLFFALQCPEEGSFIGYKKASGKIVKLLIHEDAKRSSATSRKCRCSKATVLSITNLDGSETGEKSVKSDKSSDFIYKVGKEVKVDDFDENRWNECSTGIHFFITREEAVQYQ